MEGTSMKNKELTKLANTIIKRLKAEGFHLLRYDAYSTDSIYIKIDFGMCNSIRIASHPGKQHLSYRYNIGDYIQKYEEIIREFPMEFYPITEADAMIEAIKKNRADKLYRYGKEGYERFMLKNSAENAQNTKGFWAKAKTV